MKITNKTRYKSMKRSSPMVQYARYLRGEHHGDFGFRAYGSHYDYPMFPRAISDRIANSWKKYAEDWSHVQSRTIRKGVIHAVN